MGINLIANVIEGLLGFLKDITIKDHPFCLWLWDKNQWRNLNPQGNSYSDCQRALQTMLGSNPGHSIQWIILPKNFTPPPYSVWDGGQTP
jgi:hypothetical protein